MSKKTKLLQNIKATMGETNVPIIAPMYTGLFSANAPVDYYMPTKYATEYRIGVTLGAAQLIPDDEIARSQIDGFDLVEQMKLSIGRSIAHEVYGEIRDKLFALSYKLRAENMLAHMSIGDEVSVLDMIDELLDMMDYYR